MCIYIFFIDNLSYKYFWPLFNCDIANAGLYVITISNNRNIGLARFEYIILSVYIFGKKRLTKTSG